MSLTPTSKNILPPPIVVFVRPQAPGNIGALARVMSNFACTELRLVGEDPAIHRAPDDAFGKIDWALSCKGESVLKSAKWYASLKDALAGIHVSFGTSGRDQEFDHGYARPHVLPEVAFKTLADWQSQRESEDIRGGENSPGEKLSWALVMGPEDDGLNQQEGALCQKLIRISTVDESPSINIAMAAGCVLYHWHIVNIGSAQLGTATEMGAFLAPDRQTNRRAVEEGRTVWSTLDQYESFLDYLMETLGHTQFLKYPDREAVRARIRRWLQIGPIPVGELLFGFEILYHLRAWGTGKFESRDFLKKSSKNPSH